MSYFSRTCPANSPKATFVLLHGLGSDEQDMYGLAGMIDDKVEVVCLRAPNQYGPGFAWFDIQWTNEGIQVDEKGFWQEVDRLSEAVAAMGKPNIIIGGFSQGAMMSLGLITKYPDLASNCVLLSGRGIKNPCPDFKGNIFQGHGKYDDVIGISDARRLSTDLAQLGERYEYHEYGMGHSVNEEEIAHLNAWLNRVLNLE